MKNEIVFKLVAYKRVKNFKSLVGLTSSDDWPQLPTGEPAVFVSQSQVDSVQLEAQLASRLSRVHHHLHFVSGLHLGLRIVVVVVLVMADPDLSD